ncbi:DUF3347 domain-containing protein [Algoriphagus aquimarinus]|uniref:DUF3347 domain-containing protein n=1 Tax=Algoriphagus aquimarinus TaxID=237018 RepID=UPI0030DC34F0|tara:strand:- start:515 stop:1102 length:588 start_codon:yes stop_codon:yes gene_type:complete
MKNLTRILLFSLSLSLAFACKKKVVEDDHNENMDHNEQMDHNDNDNDKMGNSSESQSMSTVSFEDKKITQLVNSYLVLKDALVETDGEKAQKAAGDFLKVIDEASDETLSNMKTQVQKVAETTDPESQRIAFDLISEQMVSIAKSSVLTGGNLYLQHCPMANGNKGANWISLSEEIRNPYFGDKMMKCGSVTEKI